MKNADGEPIENKHIATVYSGISIANSDKIDTVLSKLPADTRNWGFIIHLETPAHAIAVRQHRGTWYLTDSMATNGTTETNGTLAQG